MYNVFSQLGRHNRWEGPAARRHPLLLRILLQGTDAFDFDGSSRGQGRDGERGTCRRVDREVLGVDLVHNLPRVHGRTASHRWQLRTEEGDGKSIENKGENAADAKDA